MWKTLFLGSVAGGGNDLVVCAVFVSDAVADKVTEGQFSFGVPDGPQAAPGETREISIGDVKFLVISTFTVVEMMQ